MSAPSFTIVEQGGHKLAKSGSAWEPKMGYSRAVKCGPVITVSGTVGVNADGTYSPSLEDQTRRSFEIILAALASLGAGPEHVVRTRMFVTDVTKWQEVARVHGSLFGEIAPATGIYQIAALIDMEAQIEIEVDAYLPD